MNAIIVQLATTAGDCSETLTLVESAAGMALISCRTVATVVKLRLCPLILTWSRLTLLTLHCVGFCAFVVTFYLV